MTGVNLLFPMEVAAGCDVNDWRARYPTLGMLGNIDKRALREGCPRQDIEDEVMSKVPQLVERGGFAPMVDHAVPPDVPFENFCYFINLLREVAGLEKLDF